jgi:hypothetical protein
MHKEVALSSLPPVVKDGLTSAAGAGTIGKVESLTKKGKLVAYEAVLQNGEKRSEVQVGPDGKKLAHPNRASAGSPHAVNRVRTGIRKDGG